MFEGSKVTHRVLSWDEDEKMNEPIRELLAQAGYKPLPGFDFANSLEEVFLEKFAKLIVKECINKTRSRQMFGIEDEHNIYHAFDMLIYDLESHFGVKE